MADFDTQTSPVAHVLFGSYPFPILSVHAIYSDRGRRPGQLIEVGYVAKTHGKEHVEWVVKNRSGQLWFSYGRTMRDAIAGAQRDGTI